MKKIAHHSLRNTARIFPYHIFGTYNKMINILSGSRRAKLFSSMSKNIIVSMKMRYIACFTQFFFSFRKFSPRDFPRRVWNYSISLVLIYTGLDVSDDKSDMCARLIIWKSRFMANDGVIIFNDLVATRIRVYGKKIALHLERSWFIYFFAICCVKYHF